MSYYLIPSLDKLRDEINEKYPNRDKTSDGWIGDASHAARYSSHNPDWSHGGAVRAIDVDNNGAVGANTPVQQDVLKATTGDSRVWYNISNGIIRSRTYGWAARRYTGSNPHDHHVHVSATEVPSDWTDTSTWLAASRPAFRVRLLPVSLGRVRRQFLRALGVEKGKVLSINGVARIQRSLNALGHDCGTPDGIVGRKTLNAWGAYERSLPGKPTGRPRIPDQKSLGALARARGFRVTR